MPVTYTYFPGCSLETSAKEFDTSTRAVFKKLDIGLKEIPDWSCCGSSAAHKVDRDMAAAVAGRNLVLAGRVGGDIVAPCASCFMSLKEAIIELEHESLARAAMAEVGLEYLPGSVGVLSVVEAAKRALDSGLFEGKVVKPLDGLKVASYYGCLLVRPPQVVQFDDPENPTSMDDIMSAVGATPVEWSHKTECCGAAAILFNKDMTLSLVSKVLNAAILADADVIAVACPMCQSNLANRHSILKQKYGLKREIPVLYLTQLMGAAMNANDQELAIDGAVMRLINKRRNEVKVVG